MHRIAIRSLLHDKGKLIGALAGVAFATVLILVQFGIYLGFLQGATTLVHGIGGDVWVMARGTKQIEHVEPLSPGALASAAQACVARLRPVVIGVALFRTESGGLDSLQVVGTGLDDPRPVPWSFARGLPADLRAPDRVAIDVSEVSKFDVAGDPLGARLVVGDRDVYVAALTRGIRSLALMPYLFTNLETARRLLRLGDGQATYWVLDLQRRECVPDVIRAVERDPALQARTAEAFAKVAESYLVNNSGIGSALGFIAFLGFVVGVVVVGQTLYAITKDHRRELGMLKAVGASKGELAGFVGWQALALAVVGGSLGTLFALGIKRALVNLSIGVVLSPGSLAFGLSSVVAMCALASVASVRAVVRLEAAEVLQTQ